MSMEPQYLGCIQGVKVSLALIIAIGHEFVFMVLVIPSLDFKYMMELTMTPILVNLELLGYLVPDMFFLISAALVSYSYMKFAVEKNKVPNIWTMYILRYLRWTPAIAVILLIFATLPFLSVGVHGSFVANTNINDCETRWWKILLYVNNYDFQKDILQQCIGHTWSMAVLMQMFWISPLFLYALLKWPKMGMVLIFIAAILSALSHCWSVYSYKLFFMLSSVLSAESRRDLFSIARHPTYQIATPYLIGIALGYILHRNEIKPIKLSEKFVTNAWILTISGCIGVITYAAILMSPDYSYNALEQALFAVTCKTFIVLALSWLVFACVSGRCESVNSFLSWKGFAPLSRLSYSMYLIGVLGTLDRLQRFRGPFIDGFDSVVELTTCDIAYILVTATLFNITFEAPFLELVRIVMRKDNSEKQLNATAERTKGTMNGEQIEKKNT